MCRILCVRGVEPFDIAPHLAAFAQLARESREYQGDGWGCAWIDADGWRLYRDISPVWEDAAAPSGRTTLLLAHARSAYRGEGIRVENNMPFFDGERAFIFNGELHGVRIKERGRIGAEKVFNFVKRFGDGDMGLALERGLDAIEKRTRYVRAMNLIVADAARRGPLRDPVQRGSGLLPDACLPGGRRADPVLDALPGLASESDGRRTWTPVANGAIGTF